MERNSFSEYKITWWSVSFLSPSLSLFSCSKSNITFFHNISLNGNIIKYILEWIVNKQAKNACDTQCMHEVSPNRCEIFLVLSPSLPLSPSLWIFQWGWKSKEKEPKGRKVGSTLIHKILSRMTIEVAKREKRIVVKEWMNGSCVCVTYQIQYNCSSSLPFPSSLECLHSFLSLSLSYVSYHSLFSPIFLTRPIFSLRFNSYANNIPTTNFSFVVYAFWCMLFGVCFFGICFFVSDPYCSIFSILFWFLLCNERWYEKRKDGKERKGKKYHSNQWTQVVKK